jgi:hypothetical protein
VPNPPAPAEGTSPAPSIPPSVRVAVIVMAVLAALLLINAGLLWFGYDAAVARIVRDSDGVSRAEAEQFVTLSLVPYLVIGLILALSAWFLPRRQAWARWIGLAAAALLGLITLLTMLAAGGITIASLLVLVLSAAAVTSLVARTTADYVPRLRSRA